MRAREVRAEVLTGPERRRCWSVEEKLRILAQSVASESFEAQQLALQQQLAEIGAPAPLIHPNLAEI